MLQKFDDVIASLERVLLLVGLGMMTLLVGLDVTQRTFSRPVGRTEAIMATLVNSVAGPLDDAGRAAAHNVGTVFFVAIGALLFVFAAHTARGVMAERSGSGSPALAGSIGRGVTAFVAVGAFVKILLVIFPSSVPGAQKFALGFMLWSGMLGASLATRQRRHIVLDPIIKQLKGGDRRRFAFLSGLVSGFFCLGVFALGILQLNGEIREWAGGEGVGVYPALPIPMWVATLSIPATFAVMAFRFWKNAFHDLAHGPPTTADAHSVDLDEVEKLAVAVAAEQGVAT